MKYCFFIIYMLVINLLAVILTVQDKKYAECGKRRIRERTLLFVALLGGSVAMFFTMRLIDHKTRHLKFMLGIPIIYVLQVAAAGFAFWMRF